MSIRIEIDGTPAIVLNESLELRASAVQRRAVRLLQLHSDVLKRIARHGSAPQRERFATRAVGVGVTPVTRRLLHEVEEDWCTELHPALTATLRLLRDRRATLRSVELGAPIASVIVALERLEKLVGDKARPLPAGKGRPKGPQRPRKAAAIVWRLASDWLVVFGKPPSASTGSVFIRVCELVLAAVDQPASEPKIRHAVRNWTKHESGHPYSERADVDRFMAMRLEALKRDAGIGD